VRLGRSLHPARRRGKRRRGFHGLRHAPAVAQRKSAPALGFWFDRARPGPL